MKQSEIIKKLKEKIANDPKVSSWTVLGKFFGYPDCCIEEFENRFGTRERRKLFGTGYVPCKSCNETYSEKELVENIAKNRSCPSPFPHSNLNRFQILSPTVLFDKKEQELINLSS